jgi:thiamine monophosphate kinase
VNLSDLAACGAEPLAFTLALSLPGADEAWLEGFSRGLLALADAHGCELVGGDTTRGPLNICITVFGEVPAGRSQALLRSGAQARRRRLCERHAGRCAAGARSVPRHDRVPEARLRPGRANAWSNPRRASRWARRCAASPRRRWM